ncbi:MAG: hypothetical protein KBT88_14285 [Gammaproteobacteria bacterium]|nr:hypothetical protein [Gammaproteobacteria bacterium]MBQ0840951.1 hypothetical protein [Gammaproteobacteria bacterium]
MGEFLDRLMDSSIGLVVLLVLSLLVGVGGGYLRGSEHFAEAAIAQRKLQLDFDQQALQLAEQESQHLVLQLGSEVDRQALEKMRRTVVVLDRKLSVYQEELDLYRNLVKSDQLEKGLQISNFLIRSTETPGVYRYRFALRKTEGLAKTTKVSFSVELEGVLAGKAVVYSLAQLDPGVDSIPINSRFKYFQLIEGTIHLPDGFEPESIRAKIWPSAKKARSNELLLSWDLARGQTSNK